MLVDVARGGHAAEVAAELFEQREQLLACREASRHQAGLPFGPVPAAEVLDHRLRMDGGLRVAGELPHRGRASQPLGGLLQLGEDLLVAVALPDSGLELGQRLAVDIRHRAVDGLAGHCCKSE